MEKKAPLSANKRNLVVGVMMLVALFMFLDPLQFLTPKPGPAKQDFAEQELKTQSGSFLSDSRPAAETVLKLFDERKIVLVGGHLLVKEHLDFFAHLISLLPATKVRLIGVEFLLASDQVDIDRMVMSETWDESRARQLVFHWQALCGYQENLTILKAVWQVNHDRPAGSSAYRLIGLNVAQDLTVIKRNEDFTKAEIMKQVFAKGVPDGFMATQVLESIKDPVGGGQILVFGQTSSAVSQWPDESYTNEMAKRGFLGQKRLGVLVSAALGKDSVASVLLSGPWNYHDSKTGIAWPVDGLVDQLLQAVEANRLPLAWGLQSAAIGGAECRLNDFVIKQTKADAGPAKQGIPRLRDLAEVLVSFGPVNGLHPITALADFINEANLAAAIKTLPATNNPASINVAQLNDSIMKVSAEMRAQLDSFR